ncbi:MAG: GDSL-type esterase/lipase family protein [Bacteroidota bacterium]
MRKHLFTISIIVNLCFLVLVIRHYVLMPGKPSSRSLSYFVNRNVLLRGLPKDTTDILFVGDSQFQGFEASELFGSVKFKNRGIYYDTSKGLLNRIEDLAIGLPHIIFIEIGINDLQNGVPLDTVYNNLNKTVNIIKAKSPRTIVCIQSVLPIKKTFGEKPQSLEKNRLLLNKMYLILAEKHNADFINLDQYFLAEGLNSKYDVGDGIHLNAAGYFKWTEVLRNHLSLSPAIQPH